MSNKDNIILKMGESYEPNWIISAPGNSMYIEVQHENTIGALPSDALINNFVSNLVKLCKKRYITRLRGKYAK